LKTENDIKEILEFELSQNQKFDNWHGISKANLSNRLVDPYEVNVFGEDKVDPPTKMWLVLKERENESEGYLIAYEQAAKEWYLVEILDDGTYFCDTAGDSSLFEALSNM